MYWILFMKNVGLLRIVKSKSEIGPIVPNCKINNLSWFCVTGRVKRKLKNLNDDQTKPKHLMQVQHGMH